MLENQFIKFKTTIPQDGCEFALPLLLGGEGISFFVDATPLTLVKYFQVCKRDGEAIPGLLEAVSVVGGYAGQFFGNAGENMHLNKNTMLAALGNEKCFRLRASLSGSTYQKSYSFEFTYEYVQQYGTIVGENVEVPFKIYVSDSESDSDATMQVDLVGSDSSGYMPKIKDDEGHITTMEAYGAYGREIGTMNGTIDSDGYITLKAVFFQGYIDNLREEPLTISTAVNDIVVVINSGLVYSNLIHIVENEEDFSFVKYVCDESSFGFPFGTDGTKYLRAWLPIRIDDPQFRIADKTYEKLDGEKVVLYSAISKEYNLETEYIPEEWHDKLIAALCSDHVFIDGVNLNKSGEYSIEWDKYTTAECGKKVVRATCKMTTNFNTRNSNY